MPPKDRKLIPPGNINPFRSPSLLPPPPLHEPGRARAKQQPQPEPKQESAPNRSGVYPYPTHDNEMELYKKHAEIAAKNRKMLPSTPDLLSEQANPSERSAGEPQLQQPVEQPKEDDEQRWRKRREREEDEERQRRLKRERLRREGKDEDEEDEEEEEEQEGEREVTGTTPRSLSDVL